MGHILGGKHKTQHVQQLSQKYVVTVVLGNPIGLWCAQDPILVSLLPFLPLICASQIAGSGRRRPIVGQDAHRGESAFKSPFSFKVSHSAPLAGKSALLFSAAIQLGVGVGVGLGHKYFILFP